MQQFPRRLLTVVTEAVLERELVAELEALGVRGYTITDARGKGSRGRRQSDWAQESNIRVEVVCEPALAERLNFRHELALEHSLGDDGEQSAGKLLHGVRLLSRRGQRRSARRAGCPPRC